MPSGTKDAAQVLSNLTAGSNHLRQKRARSQLSCIPCRSGKLKCNRERDPACDQCIKRNRESNCAYLPPPTKQKPAQNVKGRIRQLETLVVDLMKQQNAQNGGPHERSPDAEVRDQTGERNSAPFSQPTPPSDSDSSPLMTVDTAQSEENGDGVDSATTPFGQMRISGGEISYVGDSHWQAILSGISDLKRDLGDDEEEEGAAPERPHEEGGGFANLSLTSMPLPPDTSQPFLAQGMGFMLGGSSPVTREALIAAVPEKKVTDRLLSLWFNSPDPFKPIIHAPAFQEEYRQFWRDANQTPTMWLGLLFSIISLSASFGLRDINPHSQNARTILADVNKYHTLAASAAVLADFTKPKQYTIECLILYAAGLRSNDAYVNVWLMIGLVVRLSLRMGYHRDPSSYPKISTFDGEMRRRTWAIISMIDVLISFQLGLPSMVKTIQSDTQPPRNLLDRDFNRSMKVLPPSRGIDELTPSSYTRAKLQIVRVFADATELSHATVLPAYDEMMELDRRLEEAKEQIPPLLQMPDISEVVTDPAEQLMCRFNLDLLYLKTKTVLHRRWMEQPFATLTPEEQDIGIGRSRKACVDAALRVLQHHHTIYSASQSGGQLESVKWYMGSISTHDFLLAAMVICLELSHQISNDPAINPNGRMCSQRAALMDALEKSHKIWSDASGRKRKLTQFVARDELNKGEHMFDETERASRAMAVMLQKVKAQFPSGGSNGQPQLSQSRPMGHLQPVHRDMSFSGIVGLQDWNNMADVPPEANLADAHLSASLSTVPTLNGSDGFSQSNSNNTSPDYSDLQNIDFSMIGDMLDVEGTLDWETWDNEINKGHTPRWSTARLQDETMAGLQIGNALIGGSGPGGLAVAGTPGSRTTVDAVGNHVYPGSWMSFPDTTSFDNVEWPVADATEMPLAENMPQTINQQRSPQDWLMDQ